MMSDRYTSDINQGLLLYLKSGEIFGIQASRDELRAIVIARNDLVRHMVNKASIPSMIRNAGLCSRCFHLNNCVIYHKAVENGSAESSGIATLFQERTQHLKQSHFDYFSLWNDLLRLENDNQNKQVGVIIE